MRFDEATLFVFMLAAFLGFELIRRVSPLLHTPLMSLTNAISAIAVVGAVLDGLPDAAEAAALEYLEILAGNGLVEFPQVAAQFLVFLHQADFETLVGDCLKNKAADTTETINADFCCH